MFASEEEAFAAAEEVYRAYNDALNARFRDETYPDPQTFLTGLALEGDIDGQNQLRDWGLQSAGQTAISSFKGIDFHADHAEAVLIGYVCIDVSRFRVLNAAGEDVTPPERGDVVAQSVTFVGTPRTLLISNEESAEESQC
ncbi:hypothetical protein [Microbacterium sp. 3J1]|uniref:hypothetical protein n=1 Tax=Microbacterium sp. 3J1 TaxID=861269 RepID=UPI000A94C804|nr:hypothetical protein [Microbacterium sp. 3J1]